jgi:lysophospholipase L1-like esterase
VSRSQSPVWTHTWTAMPQRMETGLAAGVTLRQTVHLSIGGPRLRVRFSHAFGDGDLPIAAAAVGRPVGDRAGVAAIVEGSGRPLTFGGRPSVVVPPGAHIVSDPVDLAAAPGANLTVTVHLGDGWDERGVTGHPGSRTTSYLCAGDRHAEPDLAGATPVEQWFLISGVEVAAAAPALIAVGDSLTDGRGTTTDGNDRWTDLLFARGGGVAVLNQGGGGNRVLADGIGPSVLARLDSDVLAIGGADRMLLFAGVNDIGTAPATVADQKRAADDLLIAYEQVVLRARARGLRVYGATLTPLGGNDSYDDPGGLRESTRQAVNERIRHGQIFDGVADFDAAVRDPRRKGRLAASFDTGDHLHLSPAGYRALADAVPADWIS